MLEKNAHLTRQRKVCANLQGKPLVTKEQQQIEKRTNNTHKAVIHQNVLDRLWYVER